MSVQRAFEEWLRKAPEWVRVIRSPGSMVEVALMLAFSEGAKWRARKGKKHDKRG